MPPRQGVQSVEYFEMTPGSPKFALETDAVRATRTFRVKWADIGVFWKEMLGYPEVVSGKLKRWLPGYYPDYLSADTGKPWLFATKVLDIEGLGDKTPVLVAGDKIAQYEFGKVTVLYESLPYDVLADDEIDDLEALRFVVPTERSSIQYVTASKSGFVWDSPTESGSPLNLDPDDPAKDGQCQSDIGLLLGSEVLEWTWLDLPDGAYNWAYVKSCRGTLNNASFAGYDAEKLLLLDAQRVRRQTPRGDRSFEIKFTFLSKGNHSHNHFLNQAGNYQRIRKRGSPRVTGPGVFQLKDFVQLFKP